MYGGRVPVYGGATRWGAAPLRGWTSDKTGMQKHVSPRLKVRFNIIFQTKMSPSRSFKSYVSKPHLSKLTSLRVRRDPLKCMFRTFPNPHDDYMILNDLQRSETISEYHDACKCGVTYIIISLNEGSDCRYSAPRRVMLLKGIHAHPHVGRCVICRLRGVGRSVRNPNVVALRIRWQGVLAFLLSDIIAI